MFTPVCATTSLQTLFKVSFILFSILFSTTTPQLKNLLRIPTLESTYGSLPALINFSRPHLHAKRFVALSALELPDYDELLLSAPYPVVSAMVVGIPTSTGLPSSASLPLKPVTPPLVVFAKTRRGTTFRFSPSPSSSHDTSDDEDSDGEDDDYYSGFGDGSSSYNFNSNSSDDNEEEDPEEPEDNDNDDNDNDDDGDGDDNSNPGCQSSPSEKLALEGSLTAADPDGDPEDPSFSNLEAHPEPNRSENNSLFFAILVVGCVAYTILKTLHRLAQHLHKQMAKEIQAAPRQPPSTVMSKSRQPTAILISESCEPLIFATRPEPEPMEPPRHFMDWIETLPQAPPLSLDLSPRISLQPRVSLLSILHITQEAIDAALLMTIGWIETLPHVSLPSLVLSPRISFQAWASLLSSLHFKQEVVDAALILSPRISLRPCASLPSSLRLTQEVVDTALLVIGSVSAILCILLAFILTEEEERQLVEERKLAKDTIDDTIHEQDTTTTSSSVIALEDAPIAPLRYDAVCQEIVSRYEQLVIPSLEELVASFQQDKIENANCEQYTCSDQLADVVDIDLMNPQDSFAPTVTVRLEEDLTNEEGTILAIDYQEDGVATDPVLATEEQSHRVIIEEPTTFLVQEHPATLLEDEELPVEQFLSTGFEQEIPIYTQVHPPPVERPCTPDSTPGNDASSTITPTSKEDILAEQASKDEIFGELAATTSLLSFVDEDASAIEESIAMYKRLLSRLKISGGRLCYMLEDGDDEGVIRRLLEEDDVVMVREADVDVPESDRRLPVLQAEVIVQSTGVVDDVAEGEQLTGAPEVMASYEEDEKLIDSHVSPQPTEVPLTTVTADTKEPEIQPLTLEDQELPVLISALASTASQISLFEGERDVIVKDLPKDGYLSSGAENEELASSVMAMVDGQEGGVHPLVMFDAQEIEGVGVGDDGVIAGGNQFAAEGAVLDRPEEEQSLAVDVVVTPTVTAAEECKEQYAGEGKQAPCIALDVVVGEEVARTIEHLEIEESNTITAEAAEQIGEGSTPAELPTDDDVTLGAVSEDIEDALVAPDLPANGDQALASVTSVEVDVVGGSSIDESISENAVAVYAPTVSAAETSVQDSLVAPGTSFVDKKVECRRSRRDDSTTRKQVVKPAIEPSHRSAKVVHPVHRIKAVTPTVKPKPTPPTPKQQPVAIPGKPPSFKPPTVVPASSRAGLVQAQKKMSAKACSRVQKETPSRPKCSDPQHPRPPFSLSTSSPATSAGKPVRTPRQALGNQQPSPPVTPVRIPPQTSLPERLSVSEKIARFEEAVSKEAAERAQHQQKSSQIGPELRQARMVLSTMQPSSSSAFPSRPAPLLTPPATPSHPLLHQQQLSGERERRNGSYGHHGGQ